MLVLGIDLETSGLSSTEDRIIEVGAVLFDWETKTPVKMLSEFIDPAMDDPALDGFLVSEEITEITGISNEMIVKYGDSERDVMNRLAAIATVGKAAYFMGHNCKDFDCRFFVEACKRANLLSQIQWLDTMTDIKFPPRIKTRNLQHLAAEHGFLNPFRHRAVFDVLTMLQVASCYRLEDIIARANEATVIVQANVTYQENQKAKDFNFRWNPQQKIWWKEQKVNDFAEEKDQYKFNISYLTERPVEA